MKAYTIEQADEGYLLFTINRMDKRNAINYEIMDGLEEALALASSEEVKALVITGAGDRAFCSGGDLAAFHELRTEEEAYRMLHKMSKILSEIFFFPKPTIALINGTAVGGGCELASACDFRIARKGIKAGFIQGTLAITTGWGGGTMILEKLQPSKALKMLNEACTYETDALENLGFIDYSFEGDSIEALKRFLNRMLKIESSVAKAYKEMLIRKWVTSGMVERIEAEVRQCAILWAHDKHHEKVANFFKK